MTLGGRGSTVLVFTGRLMVPSFVAACFLAALAFVIGSAFTVPCWDLDIGAVTFIVTFSLIAGLGWIWGWGEDDS